VDALGNVTGVQAGSANITATYNNPSGSNFTATTTVAVTAGALAGVILTTGASVQSVGIPIQLHVIGSYSDGSQLDITDQAHITSSNPVVAVVNNLGVVTPAAVGSTQITATLDGITGNLTLNIGNAVVQTISVNAASPVAVGASTHLTATGTFSDSSQQDISSLVTWSSSNPSIGIVDPNGNATGVTVGTVNAIATFQGISGQAAVQITSATSPTLTSITVTPSNITLLGSVVTLLGVDTQFTATGNYSDGSTLDLTPFVQWSTSNSSAAVVNSQGQIQLSLEDLLGLVGLGPNTITIIATSGSISGNTQVFLTVL
jgi:trimeric autotransporter adhesin